MSYDAYFRMGSTHSVCQDYAIAGETTGIPRSYALLADGCSGVRVNGQPGSPYTDFGCRFLVTAAQRHLLDLPYWRTFAQKVIVEADAMRRQMSLPRTSLDATLLGVLVDEANVSIFRAGDGLIVTRFRDGRVRCSTKEYAGGYPFYLHTILDQSLGDIYFTKAPTYTQTEYTREYGTWSKVTETFKNLPNNPVDSLFYSRDDVDLVLLLSDGAESFKQGMADVPVTDILEPLLDIRRYTGEFITRTCNYVLHNICAKNGWQHHDDFSLAGVYIP